MPNPEKDLEALRKEHDHLGTTISRFTVVTLAAICFFVISFSRACKNLSNDYEIRASLCRIRTLSNAGSESNFRDNIESGFEVLPEQMSTCATPTPTPTPTATPAPASNPNPGPGENLVSEKTKATPTSDNGTLTRTLRSPNQSQSPTPAATPEGAQPAPTLISDGGITDDELAEMERSAQRQRESDLAEAVTTKAIGDEAFTLKNRVVTLFTKEISVLGFKFEVNLLYWVPISPLLFLIAQSYIFVLWVKQRLIRCVAAHQINQAASPGEIAKVDYLVFGNSPGQLTAYSKHPATLQVFLYLLALISIFAYFIASIIYFWKRSPTESIVSVGLFISIVLWITAFYSVAYCQYVSMRLAKQVKESFQCEMEPGLLGRFWRKLSTLCPALIAKLGFKPRISLLTGSLLVLSTLFLATASSCENQPRTGYELVTHQNDAAWFLDTGFLGPLSGRFSPGRYLYITSIIVAAITLAALLYHRFSDSLLPRPLLLPLFILSGTASLFVLAEFGFVFHFNIPFIGDALRIIYWLIPLTLWLTLGVIFSRRFQTKWRRIRTALILFHAPGVVMWLLTFYSVTRAGLVGLPLYFIGVNILSLTYMQLLHLPPGDAERHPAGEDISKK